MKTCEECYYYVELGEGKKGNGDTTIVGNCFRYPPVVVVDKGSQYPIVGSTERECGEFKLGTPKKRTRR